MAHVQQVDIARGIGVDLGVLCCAKGLRQTVFGVAPGLGGCEYLASGDTERLAVDNRVVDPIQRSRACPLDTSGNDLQHQFDHFKGTC